MPPEDRRNRSDDPAAKGDGFPFIGAPCGCEPSVDMPGTAVIISDRRLSAGGFPAAGKTDEVPQPTPKQAAPGHQPRPV